MGRGAHEGRPRSLFPWIVATAMAAMASSIAIAVHHAPVWGDVGVAQRVQAAYGLPQIAAVINELGGPWQWLYGLGAIVLLLTGLRIGGGLAGSQLRREALWASLAAAALRPASGIIKDLVASPRPAPAFGIRVDELRDSFGFPSGHVYGDVLVLGVLAVYARAFLTPRFVEPFRVLVVVVLVAAGPSRVVAGAHWPSDVLGGYLWGTLALLIAIAVGRWGGRRRWDLLNRRTRPSA